MRITMNIQIAGTRNGVAWPAPGGEVELPDYEAARLCDAGYATPVAEKASDKAERAVAPQPEKRGPGRPRKSTS